MHDVAPLTPSSRDLDQVHRHGIPAAEGGQQSAGLPRGGAVHRTEHRDLGPPSVTGEAVVGERGVEIRAGRDALQRSIAGHRREDPRFELRGIGNDECVPGIRDNRSAQRAGDLQRSAAPTRPPAGHDPAWHVLAAKPAVPHPLREPGPPVRGVQPGQLLVLQQRCHGGMIQLPEHPRPRRRDVEPDAPEGRPDIQHRVCVHREAECRVDAGGQLDQRARARAWRCRRAEGGGEDLAVNVRPPRQSGPAHLDGGETRRRLGGGQQGQRAVVADPAPLGGDRSQHSVEVRRHRPIGRIE